MRSLHLCSEIGVRVVQAMVVQGGANIIKLRFNFRLPSRARVSSMHRARVQRRHINNHWKIPEIQIDKTEGQEQCDVAPSRKSGHNYGI
jgi:hypothetical protein